MQAFSSARVLLALAFVATLTGVFAVGTSTAATAQELGKTMTTPSGLQITDTKMGAGATPRPGQICVMHYTGWLYQGGAKGQKFDSSLDRGRPFEFPIGRQRVIAGWDEGVAGRGGPLPRRPRRTRLVGPRRPATVPTAAGEPSGDASRTARCSLLS